ncbi:hypothetical protein N7486_006881 [Penicillium sp. IBT 16267x]|nr:hypothetical protein N7486_006881 [Penicillium sp. IBT 16267x]
MKSLLEHRRIYKQLEKQIVIKHGYPDDVCTDDRRYSYRGEGGMSFEEPDPGAGPATDRSVPLLSVSIGVLLCSLEVPYSQKLVRRDIYRPGTWPKRSRPRNKPLHVYVWCASDSNPFILEGKDRSTQYLYVVSAHCGYRIRVRCFVSLSRVTTFENHPASVLASLQMFQLVAAGVMATLADIMYRNLGVAWTMTLLGGLATFFMPVLYIMYRYGPRIRRWSKHTSE